MRWLTLIFCLLSALPATAADLSELPEDEALRLLTVAPAADNASPPGASIQWEANRGQLRLYILNRGEGELYLDWTRSHITNAAGTFSLAPSTTPGLERSQIAVATSFQDALALAGGPPTAYGLGDVNRPVGVSLMLGPMGAPTVYQHTLMISVDEARVDRAAWRQSRYDMELLRARTVRRTIWGGVFGAAGVFLLANPNLSQRNGEFDEQKHTLRIASGSMCLAYGGALAITSSIRRGLVNDDLAAHDALEP